MIHQLDRPGRVLFALDEPFFLQGLQMTHDAVGRFDVEGFADLANRRAVAAVFDLDANEFVDLPLPVGELAEVRPWVISVGFGRS